MTQFCTIASGSSGNASLLSSGDTHILLDLGLSCRRVCQDLHRLGRSPEELTALVVTHEHTDHIKGLATFLKKYPLPLFCTPGTSRELLRRLAGIDHLLRPTVFWEEVKLGDVTLQFLPTSHDSVQSAGVKLTTPDGTVGFLTDTGVIPPDTGQALLGADLLVLESNHDVESLLSGPYPPPLKQRVLGQKGHLSNEDAARFAAESARRGTRSIILAHLSPENNTPQLALNAVGRALEAVGYTGSLTVAPRDSLGPVHQLEGTLCNV
jgi:phosphoribosyl 1,2-cyclic phosphodiesterase